MKEGNQGGPASSSVSDEDDTGDTGEDHHCGDPFHKSSNLPSTEWKPEWRMLEQSSSISSLEPPAKEDSDVGKSVCTSWLAWDLCSYQTCSGADRLPFWMPNKPELPR